jgi:hypothetical protein
MPWLEGTKEVKAKKVRPGDFVPGLDNAYVVEAEQERYDTVRITMHDKDGEEVTLICGDDMLVTVRLPRQPFAGL